MPKPRTFSPGGEDKTRFQASWLGVLKGKALESLKRGKLRTLGPEKLIKFPYQHKIIDFGQISDPLVKLQLKTKEGIYLNIKFLVDSGADTTTLPLNPYGKLVGFKPNEENKTIIGGVEGKGIDGYPGEIEVKLGRSKLKLRCYFIKSPVMPLLGRCDFWEKFNVCFDNHNQEVVFEPIC